ncbi:MAG: hypothetical protein WCO42_09395 [bacterium]
MSSLMKLRDGTIPLGTVTGELKGGTGQKQDRLGNQGAADGN